MSDLKFFHLKSIFGLIKQKQNQIEIISHQSYKQKRFRLQLIYQQDSKMTEVFGAIAKIRQQKISQQQEKIRQFFKQHNSPFYYITYREFLDNFQVHAGKNFKQENLNIIDMHLKYRQFAYEQMAPYKWVPIIGYAIINICRLRRPPLILPYIYTKLFDYYMEPFFVWLHKDDKIINLRNQFVTKLSKVKNMERRVNLWNKLENSLKRVNQINESGQSGDKKPQIPSKYLKFGQPTQYVFHAQTDQVQMSTVLQTSFFQTYLNLRYPTIQSFNQLFSHFKYLKDKFIEFKADQDKLKYSLDLQQFMKFKDIKQEQIYQLSTSIQKRVRRWHQTFMYDRTRKVYFSNWTMDKLFYLYQHKHLSQQPKYNIEQNAADLCIYYGLILVPAVIFKFFKR